MYGVARPRADRLTEAEAARWFNGLGGEGTVEWVVEEDLRLIGTARLHEFDAGSAKYAVGLFDPALLGRGLGTEVTRLVVHYAFHDVGLRRVHLDVLEFNQRAIGCYLKAGFQVVGRKPSDLVMEDRAVDDIVMEITARSHSTGVRGGG